MQKKKQCVWNLWLGFAAGQGLWNRVKVFLALTVLILGILEDHSICHAENIPDWDQTGQSWVIDEANLLTEEEEQKLDEKCQLIYDTYGVTAAVVTVHDFGGGDILEWQKNVFAQQPFRAESENGIMLAVSMAQRDWGIQTIGNAQRVFNTYGRERMGGIIVEKLSDGDYYGAFAEFADLSIQFLEEAQEDEPYSESHPYRKAVPIWLIVAVSFALSLLVSFLIVNSWKKSMNTRVLQNEARAYLEPGSFHLTRSSDLFLYHTVSRTPIPKSNSSSGGGRMHSTSSGTRGKF